MSEPLVQISYIRPSTGERVYHKLTTAEAREFWAALAAPLRESAIIEPLKQLSEDTPANWKDFGGELPPPTTRKEKPNGQEAETRSAAGA